ncbi:DUF4097 family beta strand repeat-containing protein [Marinilabilia rubra]|uniref:DUF4097 domain-containing protein n=1 Tax=Marinilabilia rubra TaxID=2162893 RepID=A0A2U2B6Q7_9BACT|nr:DUF4097 family beta strand repeat-containing protein [Marinilabilia rubra]PWD98759.1 hypothetical protein DDZ16_13550 [Marinilabilia rubra]
MKHLLILLTTFYFGATTCIGAPLEVVHKSAKSYDNIESLEVKGDFCKVIVTSSTNDKVEVDALIEASKKIDGFNINEKVEGTKLTLSVNTPDEHVSTKSGEIAIKVPQDCNIKVKTRSGYIEAIDISTGNLDADASYGKIILNEASGNFKLKTSTGSIQVSNLKGDLNAKTTSGDIELKDINGQTMLITDKGLIDLQNIKGSLNTQTNTSAQKISDVDGDLKLRTSTGELALKNIDGHLQTINDDGDVWIEDLKGTMDLKSISGNLNGEGILLTGNSNFETTKGRIDMALKNDQKELTYELESNYGFLYIPGKSKKKRLKSGKGSIHVTAISNNGAQRFTKAKE